MNLEQHSGRHICPQNSDKKNDNGFNNSNSNNNSNTNDSNDNENKSNIITTI